MLENIAGNTIKSLEQCLLLQVRSTDKAQCVSPETNVIQGMNDPWQHLYGPYSQQLCCGLLCLGEPA